MVPLRAARPGRSRTRTIARAIVAAIVLAASAPPAFAAPVPPVSDGEALELSWDAPGGCADVASVRQDVERVLGNTGEVHRKLRAHGEVRRTETTGWSVTLTLVTETGRSVRTLKAPTCRSLARAAAVVIAFTMTAEEPEIAPSDDPDAGEDAEPPIEAPGVMSAPRSKEGPLPKRERVPPPEAASPTARLGPTIGIFSRVDVGTLPKVGFGPGALVGWYARPIFLETTFGWLVGQDSEIVPPPRQSVTISHATFSGVFARTAICPAEPGLSFVGPTLRLFGCTGFGLLQTRVTSHPIASSSDGRAGAKLADTTIEGWSGSVFLGPRLRFAQGWFALSASADIAVPFRRQEFELTDRNGGAATVHRTSPVLVGMSLTVELSFSNQTPARRSFIERAEVARSPDRATGPSSRRGGEGSGARALRTQAVRE